MANYRQMARRAAARYGLDPGIFERQIQQESVFRPRVSSGAGAQGIAQIMPATARAWGVDPNNPRQALDAAARNMASYVRKYGGYENALRAYNAGPGAIKASHGYAETNNYVRTILGGRSPSTSGVSPGRTTTTPKHLAFDPGAEAQTAQITLPERPKLQITAPTPPAFAAKAPTSQPEAPQAQTAQMPAYNSPARFQAGAALEALTRLAQGGGTATTGGTKVQTPAGGGYRASGAKGSKVLELIYNDGGKGYGIKNGAVVDAPSVYSGVWGGHRNHVHVAAGPQTVLALGKLAQSMGLHVGENPHFGGVDPVHVPGSYHYKGEAIDVSGGASGMRRFAKAVERYNRTHRLPR
jgi:hypothetical protein